MRIWYSVLMLVALSLAAGCGKSDTAVKELTPEQEREMKERQKQAENEEMQREKPQPKKALDRVEDEERRRGR